MESNRDEAVRCLRLAEKYFLLGDKEKAEKFGVKATKLYPLREAEGKCLRFVPSKFVPSISRIFQLFRTFGENHVKPFQCWKIQLKFNLQ